ncbi:MAG: alkene reductase [Deltaproteobacteria bacterium]|jgi:N-ethylmaleimide reductase|nr:alkene reductase [Deltaproteobacteria bacterium]
MSNSENKKLFTEAKLGNLKLKNRVVMAPMTRSRAVAGQPTEIMAEYYGARASAGLIITEGVAPSANGLGYARIPGLFSSEQVGGWKKVTSAVHKGGGAIFAQLMHTGRASHFSNMLHGAQIVAPSAVALSGKIWTDKDGEQSYPTPKEMTLSEVKVTISEYVHSSKLAIEAGFDGVELHAANGYLIEQFLNPAANKRMDEFGGSAEGRQKFLLETVKQTAGAIGADRVGVRISPYGVFNDMGPFDGIDEFYVDLTKKLSAMGIAYIHVVDHSSMGAPTVSADLKQKIRENFKGLYILSGGYDADRAEVDLLERRGDLVAFGRPFIANPDLVEKLKNNAPLRSADHTKFYTPGPDGYTKI